MFDEKEYFMTVVFFYNLRNDLIIHLRGDFIINFFLLFLNTSDKYEAQCIEFIYQFPCL